MRQHDTIIKIDRWGKDHWSTLLYIESRVVDHGGAFKPSHMRDDGNEYPTRLAGGELLKGHNDWDCLEDIEAARLIEHSVGTGLHPIYTLTNEGWRVVGLVRRWKAEGKGIAKFSLGDDIRCSHCGYDSDGGNDRPCKQEGCTHATFPEGEEPEPAWDVGDRIQLNCPGKAEHGSAGEVLEIRDYPEHVRHLDRWDYLVLFDKGSMTGSKTTVPERWMILE